MCPITDACSRVDYRGTVKISSNETAVANTNDIMRLLRCDLILQRCLYYITDDGTTCRVEISTFFFLILIILKPLPNRPGLYNNTMIYHTFSSLYNISVAKFHDLWSLLHTYNLYPYNILCIIIYILYPCM